MAYDGRYDNPLFISAFLADMRLSDAELADGLETIQDAVHVMEKDDGTKSQNALKSRSGTITPADMSAASSPPAGAGTRAPPPTPETVATLTAHFEHLPPIHEDHPLQDNTDIAATEANSVVFSNDQDGSYVGLMDVNNRHQETLERFKEQALARIALRNSVQANDHNRQGDLVGVDESDESEHGLSTTTVSPISNVPSAQFTQDDAPQNTSISTAGFSEAQDESTAISDSSEDGNSSINIIVDAPKTPESLKPAKSPVVISTPSGDANKVIEQIVLTQNTTATSGERNKPGAFENESRVNAKYFSNWGTPSKRTAAPAQVRQVLVSNLPTDADLTLVQSLIHGGAIDEMTLSESAVGAVTAFVTFTTGEACEAYYERYPNGLQFKYRGRKHVATVDKGKDVDVISGVLKSYLDCGATRVVKVDGADNEWSMKALHKIAGGPGDRRKVEAITDNYRNESRSIVFRFTKISDAVAFYGQLRRSPDWIDANVQFAVDPCEKATGIHQE